MRQYVKEGISIDLSLSNCHIEDWLCLPWTHVHGSAIIPNSLTDYLSKVKALSTSPWCITEGGKIRNYSHAGMALVSNGWYGWCWDLSTRTICQKPWKVVGFMALWVHTVRIRNVFDFVKMFNVYNIMLCCIHLSQNIVTQYKRKMIQ